MERDRTRSPPEESEHRWPSPAFDPVQWRLRGAVERGGDLTLRMISRFCSSVVAMEISFRIVPEGPHFSALVASRTLASMSDRFSTTLFLWGMPWERGISLRYHSRGRDEGGVKGDEGEWGGIGRESSRCVAIDTTTRTRRRI